MLYHQNLDHKKKIHFKAFNLSKTSYQQSVIGNVFFRCFAQYPSDINDFIKSTFPEGYTKERTSNFEGDGKYTSHHVITYENGVIYNRVTLTDGSGFRDDGNILGKNLADHEKPICSIYFPGKDGLRAEVCKVDFFEKKFL